ncbi:MAG: hypothetical protein R3A44_07505 [Caldilineaceae bacterium]
MFSFGGKQCRWDSMADGTTVIGDDIFPSLSDRLGSSMRQRKIKGFGKAQIEAKDGRV